MSSPATFQLNINHFRYGNADLSLLTATSFWAITKDKQINVYCHKGDYQTTFRLIFNNVQEMNECIDLFMKTDMKPSIFYARRVIPLIDEGLEEKGEAAKKGASIEFQFMEEVQRDYFEKYCAPLFPNFTLTKDIKGDLYSAKLQSKETDTKEYQIARINTVFQTIIKRFSGAGINNSLIELSDSRFPAKKREPASVASQEWCLDHTRDYQVTTAGIAEEIRITGNTSVILPADKEEIEDWLANPEAYKGKGAEKYHRYLKAELLNALKEDPVNNARVSELTTEALKIPGFNLRDFMLTQFHQDVNKS